MRDERCWMTATDLAWAIAKKNMTGDPSASVPCGFTRDGLPSPTARRT